MESLKEFIQKFPSLAEGKILDDEKMGMLEGGGPCDNYLKKGVIICHQGPAIVLPPTTQPPKKPTLPPVIETT